jgi:beta-glucosidase
MTPWIDGVPGVLQAWYSGQEGGTALAQIVFGDSDPSGRLPVTFERRWDDNPVHDSYYPHSGSNQVSYREGVFVGYRGYQRSGVKPLFPFGYGLSYTTFRYSNLSIKPLVGSAITKTATGSGPTYEVSWDVTNTGRRPGSDVSEVYVGQVNPPVPRPAEELKGFGRVDLGPGETQRVKVLLDRRAFSYFDTGSRAWRIDPGNFAIVVGHSVDQIELRTTLSWSPEAASR